MTLTHHHATRKKLIPAREPTIRPLVTALSPSKKEMAIRARAMRIDKKKLFLGYLKPLLSFRRGFSIMTHITFFPGLFIAYRPGFLNELDKSTQHEQQNQNHHEPGSSAELAVDVTTQIIPHQDTGPHHEAETPDVGNRLDDI
jgi:hypothetical protein